MVVPRKRKESTHSTTWPLMQMGVCWPALFLKSTMSSLVLDMLRVRLFTVHHCTRCSTSSRYDVSSLSRMRPITVVSSANFRSLTDGELDVQLLVYRENNRGDNTQPCGAPVLRTLVDEILF